MLGDVAPLPGLSNTGTTCLIDSQVAPHERPRRAIWPRHLRGLFACGPLGRAVLATAASQRLPADLFCRHWSPDRSVEYPGHNSPTCRTKRKCSPRFSGPGAICGTSPQVSHCPRGSGYSSRISVLWSGMNQEVVQKWADKHDLATLSTALGALKTTAHETCRTRCDLSDRRTMKAWSLYMKGASALFSWCIAQNRGSVLLVTPPPGERFHPSGLTNLQLIEGPIIAGLYGPSWLHSIDIVHPQIPAAADDGVAPGEGMVFGREQQQQPAKFLGSQAICS
ncbi:uncharacterized protein B0I36DRAFT_335262 [Microdochium trichocladiopsis]|uniref:Uncharacterized protein n=1 Tax=Microdochium trichocladiopsis TaxID=1682393 RepID=A0A9P8XUD4_9PEZI|nr:uncharacterized protein B0I36DRAFT_335262 [Microdochium trichocladiopsis]KAH7018070.1 hypothetical protein B0I36DRAFT_335262 [Microdochium trichocladiopsis]